MNVLAVYFACIGTSTIDHAFLTLLEPFCSDQTRHHVCGALLSDVACAFAAQLSLPCPDIPFSRVEYHLGTS